MNELGIDLYKMLDDFLDVPISQQVINTHLKNIDKLYIQSDKERYSEEWQDLINKTEKYVPKIDFDNTYLFCILNDDLKIAQFSNKYLLDDLFYIKDFIIKNKNFKKRLAKTYIINDKKKYKYIAKAKSKNLETIYNNDNIGVKILDYVNGNKMNYLGDKYGLPNCILDKMNDSDNLKHKFIIILNFDSDLFELYYSIPYELYQNGSNAMERDAIYGCDFKDLEPNKVLSKIEEISEFL